MRHHNTLLHDLGKAMPRWRFEHLVRRTGADRRVRTLPSWSQFVALVYAQLAGITSLRELVAALGSHANHAYHLGLGPIRRSTLAEANAKRPLALYEAVLANLLNQLQPGVARGAREALRLVDATTIKLSALSGWARFSAHHHAAKLHVVYDPDALVPTFFEITRALPARVVEGGDRARPGSEVVGRQIEGLPVVADHRDHPHRLGVGVLSVAREASGQPPDDVGLDRWIARRPRRDHHKRHAQLHLAFAHANP